MERDEDGRWLTLKKIPIDGRHRNCKRMAGREMNGQMLSRRKKLTWAYTKKKAYTHSQPYKECVIYSKLYIAHLRGILKYIKCLGNS